MEKFYCLTNIFSDPRINTLSRNFEKIGLGKNAAYKRVQIAFLVRAFQVWENQPRDWGFELD